MKILYSCSLSDSYVFIVTYKQTYDPAVNHNPLLQVKSPNRSLMFTWKQQVPHIINITLTGPIVLLDGYVYFILK